MKSSKYLSFILQFFNFLLFFSLFFIYVDARTVIIEYNKISFFTLILPYIPKNIYGFPIILLFFSFFFFGGNKGGSTLSNNPFKIHSTAFSYPLESSIEIVVFNCYSICCEFILQSIDRV